MNEIAIKEYQLPVLEIIDYDKLKQAVIDDNEKYKNYIVTEDTLKDDTDKRAELRKQAKAIDDRRKEIEKEISAPIKKFKEDCDFLKKLYEESANNIDVQIKVFETKQKEAKMTAIKELYDKIVGEYAIDGLVTLEMIFDDKYLNKGYEIKKIEEDLRSKLEKITDDVQAIKDLNSTHEISLINLYLKTFDLSTVIVENNRLTELQSKTVQVEEKEEEIRQDKVNEMITKTVELDDIDPVKTFALKITGTLTQRKALKQFLDINKMKYEKIEM